MPDNRTPESRSALMSRIGPKDTQPEMIVRRLLHKLGYRFRLHRRDLPGTPDIVFPSRKVALFVHGCFWHGHNCSKGRLPKSRPEYWGPKIHRNRQRDLEKRALLESGGWTVVEVWQCQTKDFETLETEMQSALSSPGKIRSTMDVIPAKAAQTSSKCLTEKEVE